jgi:hypothetical protein
LQKQTDAEVGALAHHEIRLVSRTRELENEDQVDDRPNIGLSNERNCQQEDDHRLKE